MSSKIAVPIPTFPKYEEGEDFIVFKERFENHIKLCGAHEESKIEMMLAALNTDVYKTLKKLCIPDRPQNKTYRELMAILQSNFSPKAVFQDRYEFYNAFQLKNESVNDWFIRVKELAAKCVFGSKLRFIVKDRFVCGLRAPIFERIFEMEANKTLEVFVMRAVAIERSLIDDDKRHTLSKRFKDDNGAQDNKPEFSSRENRYGKDQHASRSSSRSYAKEVDIDYKHKNEIDRSSRIDNKVDDDRNMTYSRSYQSNRYKQPSSGDRYEYRYEMKGKPCWTCGRTNHQSSECRLKHSNFFRKY